MANDPLVIEYYTDVLCVWAWIAQRRVEEVLVENGANVLFQHRYLDLFGDTRTRIGQQWESMGQYQGFCDHVCKAAAPFSSAPVNPECWSRVRPHTSTNAHLAIKAVEEVEGQHAAIDFALTLRKAFFIDAQDIGNLRIVLDLAGRQFNLADVQESIANGTAIAALMADYQQAKLQGIKGSPSYVIDNGRQTLYGNIGYRVLYANINELLRHPSNEASWC
ncbi:MAG: DsbA family protein [Gammaproteobacteria bacterium]|jgi:predicted DsbA family dithiol-disulfide isomerase